MLAATCAATGQAKGLIAPRLDTGIVNLFPGQLSQTLSPDVQAVLVWDGAGGHSANELAGPENITRSPLPPDVSERRRGENPRHDPRSQPGSNRKYDTMDDRFDAAATAGRATGRSPQTIHTVDRDPYAEPRVNCWDWCQVLNECHSTHSRGHLTRTSVDGPVRYRMTRSALPTLTSLRQSLLLDRGK
jgi:hypothetical protein